MLFHFFDSQHIAKSSRLSEMSYISMLFEMNFSNFFLPTHKTKGHRGERSKHSNLLIPILEYSTTSFIVSVTLHWSGRCLCCCVPGCYPLSHLKRRAHRKTRCRYCTQDRHGRIQGCSWHVCR